MRYYTWYEIGVHQTSTAGAAVDLDSMPIQTKNPYHFIEGLVNFSIPTPLFAFVPEEGVDSPFFTRFELAKAPPMDQIFRARRNGLLRWRFSTDYLGMPIAIFGDPPDVTPIIAGKVLDYPKSHWALARKKAQIAAGNATWDMGAWAENIPADTYTSLVCDLLEEIQQHMLEPVIDEGVTWTLWTQAEVLGYLNQRIYQFLVETGILRSSYSTTVSAGTASVDLPTDLIEIRRVAWGNSGLTRGNTWELDHGAVGWEGSTGTPYTYIEEPLEPLAITVSPTPSANGTLSVLYVPVPTAATGDCVNLPFPNMFVPYLKYGVMADMFAKQGEANDPERAEYCAKRFEEGLTLAKLLLGSRV